MRIFLALALCMMFMYGCSVIEEVPTPDKILKTPLGTDSVKVGMTKEQVKSIWGDPDFINFEEDKEAKRSREVWTYRPKVDVPVNADYLYKTRKLYFDGTSLTKISDA